MAVVVLKVEAKFCGPASIGTVEHIKVIRKHLSLGLTEAHELVSRAAFGGEIVEIETPDPEVANALAKELREIEGPAIEVSVVE